MNLVPVLFRGKIKYLKPENIEWVRENIRDPKETMEQAIERLYVEGVQEQMEEGTPSTIIRK
jgi:hypothetical protein